MMDYREKVWLWCHEPGVYNTLPNFPGVSSATPEAAAEWFGIRNLLMVVYGGSPQPPFDAAQAPLDRFDRVVWSAVGDSSSKRNENAHDAAAVAALAKNHPNVIAGIMDDCFNPERKLNTASEIAGILHAAKLQLWTVLYRHQLGFADLAARLSPFDAVTFWHWKPEELAAMEENLETVHRLAPGKAVYLGIYLWDFDANQPIPEKWMRHQLQTAKKAIDSGTAAGMIVLGSPLIGLPIAALELTRRFLKEEMGMIGTQDTTKGDRE